MGTLEEILAGYDSLQAGQEAFYKDLHQHPELSHQEHRTAERVAKQTGALAVSISQQRETVTIFLGAVRYQLDPIAAVLAKTNQAVATLETYRQRFEQVLMLAGQLMAAHLARFDVGPLTRELPQRRKRGTFREGISGRHG